MDSKSKLLRNMNSQIYNEVQVMKNILNQKVFGFLVYVIIGIQIDITYTMGVISQYIEKLGLQY